MLNGIAKLAWSGILQATGLTTPCCQLNLTGDMAVSKYFD